MSKYRVRLTMYADFAVQELPAGKPNFDWAWKEHSRYPDLATADAAMKTLRKAAKVAQA